MDFVEVTLPTGQKAQLANNLSEIAQRAGLSKSDLMFRSGVSYSTISRLWKKDSSRVDFETLTAIAAALRVQISDIFPVNFDERAEDDDAGGAKNSNPASTNPSERDINKMDLPAFGEVPSLAASAAI
jgi:DNA-binding Xre family transcriptional regulator